MELYFMFYSCLRILSGTTLAEFLDAITRSLIASSIIMMLGMFVLVYLVVIAIMSINNQDKGLSIKNALKQSKKLLMASCGAQVVIVLIVWFLMARVEFGSLLNLLWLGFVLTATNCALYFIYGFKRYYK